jgi:hypothetical protein
MRMLPQDTMSSPQKHPDTVNMCSCQEVASWGECEAGSDAASAEGIYQAACRYIKSPDDGV